MLIEREDAFDTPLPHYLETDRVSETAALIAETAQPTINRRPLEIAIHVDHLVTRILVHTLEKLHARADPTKSHEQNLHLGKDQVGRHQLPTLVDPATIRGQRDTMARLLVTQRGKPSRGVEECLLHRRRDRELTYDSANTAS